MKLILSIVIFAIFVTMSLGQYDSSYRSYGGSRRGGRFGDSYDSYGTGGHGSFRGLSTGYDSYSDGHGGLGSRFGGFRSGRIGSMGGRMSRHGIYPSVGGYDSDYGSMGGGSLRGFGSSYGDRSYRRSY